MKHLSLFTGAGGVDLGFERAGIETVGQVEFDPAANKLLASHWPDVPRWSDIRKVDCDDLPDFDVLSGGFPCQDISLLGSRQGLDGQQSGLWSEFARIIAGTSPAWVLIENVAGLLSSNDGRDIATIFDFLEQRGFRWAYRTLDSQYFGVAQRRRRVFIVASSGRGNPVSVLFDEESSGRDAGTFDAIRNDLARSTGNYPTFSVSEGMGGAFSVKEELAPTLTKGGGKPGQGYSAIIDNQNRMRALTPVERERLQGFPDGWISGRSTLTDAIARTGNAVTVNVAEWIGRRIMAQA